MHFEIRTGDIEKHLETPEAAEALSLWRSAAAGGVPERSLFSNFAFDQLRPFLSLAEMRNGEWIFIECGEAVASLVGVNLAGQRVLSRPAYVAPFLIKTYELAASSRQPVYTIHNDTNHISVLLWERLLLPLKKADGTLCIATLHGALASTAGITKTILDAAVSGISGYRCVRDEDRKIVDAVYLMGNSRAAELLQKAPEELPGRRILEMFPGAVASGVWARYVEVVETQEPCTFEVHYTFDDFDTWFSVSCIPMGDGFVLSFADISALKQTNFELERARAAAEAVSADLESQKQQLQKLVHETTVARAALETEIECRQMLEEELRRLATVDMLTGVLNRSATMGEGTRALEHSRSSHQPMCVVAIDIDHFKSINDSHGHPAGDAVLAAVGAILADAVDSIGAIAGRIGGEEFVVFLPNATEREASLFGEGLRAAIASHPFDIGEGVCLKVTTSIGVAQLRSREDLDGLLAKADAALYHAKRSGRNQVRRASEFTAILSVG